MTNDDQPVGRLLSRREVVKLFLGGATGGLWVSAGPESFSSCCRLTSSLLCSPFRANQGPYFVDERLNRSEHSL